VSQKTDLYNISEQPHQTVRLSTLSGTEDCYLSTYKLWMKCWIWLENHLHSFYRSSSHCRQQRKKLVLNHS